MNKVIINKKKVFNVEGNSVNGNEILADILQTGERFFHILYNHQSYAVEVVKFERETKTYTLKINGNIYDVQIKDKLDQMLEQMGFDISALHQVKEVKAPMPGLVIDIRVAAGDIVKKGDAVIVLEAMKMENVLKAAADAVVKSVVAEKGKSVEKNQVLIIFE